MYSIKDCHNITKEDITECLLNGNAFKIDTRGISTEYVLSTLTLSSVLFQHMRAEDLNNNFPEHIFYEQNKYYRPVISLELMSATTLSLTLHTNQVIWKNNNGNWYSSLIYPNKSD